MDIYSNWDVTQLKENIVCLVYWILYYELGYLDSYQISEGNEKLFELDSWQLLFYSIFLFESRLQSYKIYLGIRRSYQISQENKMFLELRC